MDYRILKSIREERGYTIKKVCEETGIPSRTYQNYEYGERAVSVDTLEKLADFYKVSVDYLLGRVESPETKKIEAVELFEEMPEHMQDIFLEFMEKLVESKDFKPQEAGTAPPITCSLPIGDAESKKESEINEVG